MSLSYLCPHIHIKLSKASRQAIKCLKLKLPCASNYTSQRFMSSTSPEGLKFNREFSPFTEVIKQRRLQASNSILVQVQSPQSYKELHAYCTTFGNVKSMFHYSTGVESMHFILVEFLEQSSMRDIFSKSAYMEDLNIIPVQSTFLWFKAAKKGSSKTKAVKSAKLLIENGTRATEEYEIKDALLKAKDISSQMVILHELTKLNDIGIRLRYMVAKQVEAALSGMFPNAVAYPFGSSVNGYGKMGCDLDLVLRLNKGSELAEDNRLVFHCKAASGSERSTSQKHMETIGDILHLFLPGCSQVRKILQARVPIIKYYQQLADVECDLSTANMSGVHMSDFLYMMGAIDDRVQPLVFTIRKWAHQVGLTNSSPGRWITNFSLTLLVLAFLQNPGTSPPILPTLKSLMKLADPQDTYITEDGIDCSFARDINKLNFLTSNTDSLQSLLQQFFEHYSNFDFSTKAVSLNEGTAVAKPEHSSLYIVNPLERGLNVSKNVSADELDKFKIELRNAAWTLETHGNRLYNWGILSLFEKKHSNVNALHRNAKLIEVSKLFEEDDQLKEDDMENHHVANQTKGETQGRIKRTVNNVRSIKNLDKRKSGR